MCALLCGLTPFLFVSAERAKFWVTEIQKHEEECRICLCGTKLDLVQENPKARQVDVHDMTDYADMVRLRGPVALTVLCLTEQWLHLSLH